jgi:ABC-2 type transport system permease protein
MRHLTKGLTITTYSNLFDDKSLTPSDVKDFETTLEPYIRFKPDIRLKYIWYYDDGRNHPDEEAYRKEALKTAMMKDVDFDKYLSPKEIREMIDLSSEEYKFVQILSYDGMTARLRNYDDPASRPMEGDYIAAFKRLGMRLPVIGMLSGHGERSIMRSMNGDYSFIMNGLRNRQSFQNLGFDVREVSLTQSSQQLDSCDLLVVADPRKPLSDWELAQLNNYVRKGGNMMVLAERESMPILTPLLDTLGISMSDSYLLQENKGELPDLVLCNPAQTSIKINKYFKWYLNSNIAMQGASTLKWKPTSGFTYIPLTVTLPSTWLSTNLPQVNDDGTYVCSGKQGKFVTAVGLTRNISGHKQQRILVTGDADWISNGELNRQRAYIQTSQFDFIKPLVQWFSYGELPVDVSRNIPPDTMLHFSQGLVRPMHWFFWCIVPLLFAITGNIIIVKRKRK